jgi:hypothetical protein
MKNIHVGLTLLIVLFSNGLYAQKKDDLKKQVIERVVTSRNYIFKAENVMPTGAVPNRQLSFGYDLRVSPDTIVSYLPYFGRAYTAPMDPTKGGIQFTSVKFEYKETKRKKGGWDIVIKPQDTQDASQMVLTVSETGFASLQVIGNNRQPISFSGYVDEKKSKK